MSQENLLTDDEVLSPDMFSDPEVSISAANMTDDSTSSASGNISEPVDTFPQWKGVSMNEICKGFSPYDFEHLPPIVPSQSHAVLFALPVPSRGAPKVYPSQPVDKWNQDYVRLPHSPHSRYPNNKDDESQGFRQRWEVIQEALLQSFYSSRQLELAILSYNHKYSQRWDFKALHHFFSNVVDQDEADIFFENLLPKIISLALQLPELITGGIPLLKRHMNASISLSQLQVACLLANAFLCTFPRRNSSNPQSEYANYPHINFNRLFSSMTEKRSNRTQSVMEKLKCIFHYFRRVTTKVPTGTITIQRKYIPKENFPKWETCDEKLPLLHITSKGTIEHEGSGLLQVDFANKYVGGGVMNFGCVQEEIRFVICPELFVAMLVTEALDDTEALVVCGVEQYSKYEGYSDNFQWAGDFVDETPRDNSGRRKTCIVAIDALHFRQPNSQFNMNNIVRELNKAYVGFCTKEMPTEQLCAIATGNWGCGAFRGNPKLKVLLQLIAASVANRSVVYFTFGDTELRDKVADMYWYLIGQNVTIAQLYNMLSEYNNDSKSSKKHSDFYLFLYNKAKMKSEQSKDPKQPKLTFQHKLSTSITSSNSKPALVHSKSSSSPKSTLNSQKLEQNSNINKDVKFCKLTQEERNDVLRKMLEESDEDENMETSLEKNAKNTNQQINGKVGKKNEIEEKENKCYNDEENEKNNLKDNSNKKSSEKGDIKKSPVKSDTNIEEKNHKESTIKVDDNLSKKDVFEVKDTENNKPIIEKTDKSVVIKKDTQRKIYDFFTPVR